MTLEGPIQQVETARAELAKVAISADGWCDGQRAVFDGQRMEPLVAAGGRLLSVLKKAQDQCVRAEGLLGGR